MTKVWSSSYKGVWTTNYWLTRLVYLITYIMLCFALCTSITENFWVSLYYFSSFSNPHTDKWLLLCCLLLFYLPGVCHVVYKLGVWWKFAPMECWSVHSGCEMKSTFPEEEIPEIPILNFKFVDITWDQTLIMHDRMALPWWNMEYLINPSYLPSLILYPTIQHFFALEFQDFRTEFLVSYDVSSEGFTISLDSPLCLAGDHHLLAVAMLCLLQTQHVFSLYLVLPVWSVVVYHNISCVHFTSRGWRHATSADSV